MAKRKCTQCKAILGAYETECANCGAESKIPAEKSFRGSCEKCGKRGRLIKADKNPCLTNDTCLCFDCFRKRDDGSKFHAEAWENIPQAMLNHQAALREYYLKPLFYGDEPNRLALQKADDDYAKYELAVARG